MLCWRRNPSSTAAITSTIALPIAVTANGLDTSFLAPAVKLLSIATRARSHRLRELPHVRKSGKGGRQFLRRHSQGRDPALAGPDAASVHCPVRPDRVGIGPSSDAGRSLGKPAP